MLNPLSLQDSVTRFGHYFRLVSQQVPQPADRLALAKALGHNPGKQGGQVDVDGVPMLLGVRHQPLNTDRFQTAVQYDVYTGMSRQIREQFDDATLRAHGVDRGRNLLAHLQNNAPKGGAALYAPDIKNLNFRHGGRYIRVNRNLSVELVEHVDQSGRSHGRTRLKNQFVGQPSELAEFRHQLHVYNSKGDWQGMVARQDVDKVLAEFPVQPLSPWEQDLVDQGVLELVG
ncbi:MAG: hypothetical protein KC474_11705 [Cyanobacteria bacterium HKST-UBA04]|nr:hypothetical protein [Cyanobacteria bacterium HKST-UBA04]